MATTELILCDLGKTLVNFDRNLALKKLVMVAKPFGRLIAKAKEAKDFLAVPTTPGESARMHALERGERDVAWLADEMQRELDVTVKPEDLADAWNAIFTTWNKDVSDAMRRARSRGTRVAICSNTSRSHWEFILKTYPEIEGIYDHAYLSFEMGKMKADPGFFEEILAHSGVAPEAHLFLDDLQENLDIAAALGIPGLLFDGTLPAHPAWS